MAEFTIGTRGSPLALWQANTVAARLRAALGLGEADVVLSVIKTSGDAIQDRALSQAGGKGLFTKEIDEAQLDGRAEIAVHSAKDLPTTLPEGLVVAGYLEREDVRDALISRNGGGLADLPQGAVVGTASLRRAALIRRLRPDLRTTLLRGNVETRLRKVHEGEVDATLLALAGLKRLGYADRASALLSEADFPPAVGQGAIAITTRADDSRALAAVRRIAHEPTRIALEAERAFLKVLDGSCRTPIAGHAVVNGSTLDFRGMVLREDGSEVFEERRSGAHDQADALGAEAGRAVLAKLPAGVLPH